MTLRATSTFPIPDTGRVGMFGAAIANVPAQAPTAPNPLPVPWFSQDGDNWCWAACAMMAAQFFTKNQRTQCQIASLNLRMPNCCPAQHGGPCDQSNTVAGISQCWTEQGIASSAIANALQWKDLCDEIDARRPVESGWVYAGGGGGHVVLVIGYRVVDGTEWVVLNNSLAPPGGTDMSFAELLAAGNLGTWTDSWTGLG